MNTSNRSYKTVTSLTHDHNKPVCVSDADSS